MKLEISFLKAPERRRELLQGLLLAVISFMLSGAALELLLRTVPAAVPRGVFYGSGAYDADLGFQLPYSKVVYNKVRYVERTPNADGFMDIAHQVTKPPGVVRVGFFGDSYVESVQVPLEDVFFRQLPPQVARQSLEAFGFGLSGLGTLHARSFYAKFGRRYDLDLVVYVFVDNDPADHLDTFQRARRGLRAARPTARPAAGREGFEILPGPTPATTSLARRVAVYVKDRSLLARVVYAQLQLLSRRGGGASPTLEAHSPPSTWPPELRTEAEVLTRRLLRAWDAEVRDDEREFLVFYVPRSTELEADQGDASWRAWLTETCRELGIALVDPTPALAVRQRKGETMYDDHWSLAGHGAVAEVLEKVLEEVLEARSAVPP